MKNIRGLMVPLLIVMVVMSSCKKDKGLNLDFSPVGVLSTPNDNVSIKLEPTTSANVVFKWDAATTTDAGLILYEVAFDKEGGDFSKPIYKVVSDGAGVLTQVTLTHKDLNKIASSAGIASLASGKIQWAVMASKSTNVVRSATTRTLLLDRPAGFAVSPAELYISGSATEGGSDLASAIKLKRNEDGIFELYTSLKPGSYILTDKNSTGGTQYTIESGVIKEGTAPLSVSGSQQVYRINLDFTAAVAKTTIIQSVGLYVSAYAAETGTLDYIGNGVFEAPSVLVEFFQFSWGRDERYKFVVHTGSGNEYLGSVNQNNDPPAGKPASYFNLVPVPNSQWDNTYKFDPSADKKRVKVTLNLQPAGYNHKITVL